MRGAPAGRMGFGFAAKPALAPVCGDPGAGIISRAGGMIDARALGVDVALDGAAGTGGGGLGGHGFPGAEVPRKLRFGVGPESQTGGPGGAFLGIVFVTVAAEDNGVTGGDHLVAEIGAVRAAMGQKSAIPVLFRADAGNAVALGQRDQIGGRGGAAGNTAAFLSGFGSVDGQEAEGLTPDFQRVAINHAGRAANGGGDGGGRGRKAEEGEEQKAFHR